MTGLLDLPAEIILDIHALAHNHLFPHSHPLVHQCCRHASPRYVAKYLLALYSSFGPNDILVRALRHPVCDIEVARSIQQIWKRKSPLTCAELPRRLFRGLTASSPVPSLLPYLIETYDSSVNSHNGYPLCRAVMAENTSLIKYLLRHGAGLSSRNTLAIEIAISRKQLHLLKTLIESDAPPSPKRRKVEDRIHITPRLLEIAMSRKADDIVNYFMREKGEQVTFNLIPGVMPPLKRIMELGKVKRA